MTSVNLMHEAEHSKSVLWDNLEGWDREGDRKGFKMRGAWGSLLHGVLAPHPGPQEIPSSLPAEAVPSRLRTHQPGSQPGPGPPRATGGGLAAP